VIASTNLREKNQFSVVESRALRSDQAARNIMQTVQTKKLQIFLKIISSEYKNNIEIHSIQLSEQ
jgi:hypothetical protein